MLNSDVIKGFVEFGTSAIKFLDTIPGKLTAIAAIIVGFTKFKGFSILGLGQEAGNSFKNIIAAYSTLQKLQTSMPISSNMPVESIQAYATAVSNLTAKQQANMLASIGLNKTQIQLAMGYNEVDDAAIREATAHIYSKQATDQEKMSGQTLLANKLLLAAATLKLSDDTDALAAAEFIEANASKLAAAEDAKQIIMNSTLSPAAKAAALAIYEQAAANQTLAGSIKALFASNPVGFILSIATTIASIAIPIIRKLHQSTEELTQAADEAINKYKEAQSTLQSQKQTIDELAASYQKLSSGVDLNTNENISLTTESYQEYLDVCNDIADMYPNLVVGFDAQGNAILSLKGNVDELIQSYKDAAQAAREAVLLQGDEIFSAAKTSIEDYDEQLEAYKLAKKMANGLSTKDAGDQYGEHLRSKAIEILEQYGFESHIGTYASGDTYKSYGLKKKYNASTSEYEDDYTYEEYTAHMERINKLNLGFKNELAQQEAELNKVNTVLQAYLGNNETYVKMSGDMQTAVSSLVSALDPADFNYDDDAMEAFISSSIIAPIYENQDGVQEALSSILTLDPNTISYSEYQNIASELLNSISKFDPKFKEAFKSAFGLGDDSEYETYSNHIKEILSKDIKDIDKKIGSLSLSDLKIAGNLDIKDGTLLSWDQLIARINEVNTDITSSKTFSELSSMIEKFNDVQKQTEEIITDNTEVTQEYKDSLIELGISETDLADCFDKNNKLVVKNVSKLKQLVNTAKTSISTETALARAQARLKYKELYRQLTSLTNGRQKDAQTNKTQINLLYQEMSAIQKTIAKYSLLEQQLSDVTKTYTEFEEAQSTDSEYDYMSKTESMLVSAIQAYETGELGTETAQISIKALVPDVELEGLGTAEEKAKKAHEYLTKTLGKYFVLDFDDETGEIQSAEMKMGNLRKFIEDGFGNKVFDGEDWQHFEWSDEFLSGLEEAPDKLQYFADKMNVTKEVALAVIQEINNHDIEWLNGDYGSLFDQIVPETLDSKLQTTTQRIAELNVQLANGKITQEEYEASVGGLQAQLASGAITQGEYNSAIESLDLQLRRGTITQEEYARQVGGLNGQLAEQQTAAVNACNSFMEINDKMDESQKKLEEYQKQLSSGEDGDGNKLTPEQIEEINKQYSTELQNYENYLKQKKELENKYGPMTEYTVSIALEKQGIDVDNINDELVKVKASMQEAFNSDNFQEVNKELESTYGVISKINDNGDVEFSVTDNITDEQKKTLTELGALNEDGTINIDALYSGLTDEQKAEVDKLDSLQDKKNLIDYYMSLNGVDTVQTAMDKLVQTLDNIYELLSTSPMFKANVDEDTQTTLDSLLTKVRSWVGDHWANFKARFSKEENGDQESDKIAGVNGTVHVNGTAHKTGSFGLPSNEKDALVGELGPEMVVDPHSGRYYTVGDNGAEMVDLPKGAIIFNHKQTEQLLKNGYVTGRGKAYASGNLGSSDIFSGIRDILSGTRNLITEIKKTITKINIDNFADKYNELVNGNVDYHKRPFISPEYMRKSGWEDFDGDVATTFDVDYTVGDSSGKEYMIKVTPILDNGEVLSPEELDEYVDEVLNGADDILSSDKDNLVINIAPYVSDDQFSELDERLGDIKNNHWELVQKYAELSGDSPYTVTSGSSDAFLQSEELLSKYGMSLDELTEKLYNLKSQMNPDPLGINLENASIDTLRSSLQSLGISYDESIGKWFDGKKEFDINVSDLVSTLQEQGWSPEEIQSYCSQLSQADISGVKINVDSKEIDEALAKVQSIPTNVITTFTTIYKTIDSDRYPKYANGTVHLGRNAYSNGNFGAPKTETALVGELGPEMIVRNGKWYTVGDNGAEFTDIKKGDIIFNHKQTEDLLKNGYVTSRGKMLTSGSANAEGNAYVTFYPDKTVKSQWTGTGYSGPNDTTYDAADALSGAADSLSDSADSLSDATDEFEEVFDWVEVRLEEIDETLGLLEAKLENAGSYGEKRDIIDEMIGVNNTKLENLKAGYKEYSDYADKLLSEVPDQYKEAAKNGSIAIEKFVGEVDETTLEAIKNYREWGQKAADTLKQIEEVNATVRDLAIQKIDEARDSGDVRVDVEDSQTDILQSQVDFSEAKGEIADASYYDAMMENTAKKIEYATNALNEMQKEFDQAVQDGRIKRGTKEWYEQGNAILEVKKQIADYNIELEEYQNKINDTYWDIFDKYINYFDYMSNDTQNLIDLMSDADMVNKPDNENGWGVNDVQFTDEGLATMGLHAQGMEEAEAEAKMYADAIQNLQEQYANGFYTYDEFMEKMQELKDGQADAIKRYKEEKEAIIDVQKQRIEAIKEGIDKEVDAYEELIEKQKESLNAEKDLHDFQRSVEEKTKNIAEIDRKIAALSGDNSASAVAQRRKLMAERAEAQADLDEAYYDRSVSDQSDALDKNLENFKDEKEKEKEELDKWLEDVEQVIKESLGIVQANATEIGNTLTATAEEFNLTVSDAVLSPWREGASAISDYDETFGNSVSSMTTRLDHLIEGWKNVSSAALEAAQISKQYYNPYTTQPTSVEDVLNENDKVFAATEQPPATVNNNVQGNTNASQPKAPPSVGSTVRVKSSATHFSAQSGNLKMASFVPGGSYQVMQVGVNGDSSQILIGKNGQYTGWVWLKDLEGYAKGTKGVKKDQWAILDELGEELQLIPDGNGRLAYMKKGTSVLNNVLTERLMDLAMNPQEMIEQNRPAITPSKSIVNNEISINMNIAEVVHIDEVTNDTIPDLTKAVQKQIDSYMVKVNNALRAKVR